MESISRPRLVPKSARFQVQNQIAITSESENGEDSLSSSAENSLSDKEEQLTQEIKVLQKKLKCCKVKYFLYVPSAPPAYNKDWGRREACCGLRDEWEIEEGSGRRGGVCFQLQHTVALVIEVSDPNNPGQVLRQHVALSFKEMKQLKEAVAVYSSQAPFTLAKVQSFAVLNLIPSNWQQLCRAVLPGGDYLLWRGEYQENCLQTTRLNAQAGQAQHNLDMLTGAGAYADLANQIVFNPAVYLQMMTVATKAWKELPNKVAGDQLSKVLQGPSEPFQDYVDRILQLAGRLFGDVTTAMPIVKAVGI